MNPNVRMVGKLAVVVLVMFSFGWALIPIYKKICQVTGINQLTRTDKSAADFAKSTQVNTSRTISIEFDANSHGPWRFKAQTGSIQAHPGELITVIYDVTNTEDRTVTGQAIPSYAPQHAAQYFRKVQCFCFEKQVLEPRQSRRFPVVFVVDPKLPTDVHTITLSYTFFEYGVKPGHEVSAATPTPAAAPVGRGG
jgi:cytochrome c oxidase assembly protein subunit 11